MTAKHKTQTFHVNLDKAFAKIRNYPGARIDRKVFKIIADYANDKRVATSSLCTIADVIKTDRNTVYESVCRLVKEELLMTATIDTLYDRATFTIHPDYMVYTENDADAKRIQNIEKRLDHLTEVVANDDSGKKIVKLKNRIEKLEYDNKTLRENLKKYVGQLEEPISALANRQSLKITTLLKNLVHHL